MLISYSLCLKSRPATCLPFFSLTFMFAYSSHLMYEGLSRAYDDSLRTLVISIVQDFQRLCLQSSPICHYQIVNLSLLTLSVCFSLKIYSCDETVPSAAWSLLLIACASRQEVIEMCTHSSFISWSTPERMKFPVPDHQTCSLLNNSTYAVHHSRGAWYHNDFNSKRHLDDGSLESVLLSSTIIIWAMNWNDPYPGLNSDQSVSRRQGPRLTAA